MIDAEGQTLGRVASLAAYYIRGKNLPTYTPSMDMGGYGEAAAAAAAAEWRCWLGACQAMLMHGLRASFGRQHAGHCYCLPRLLACPPTVTIAPTALHAPAPAVVIVNAEKVAVTGAKEEKKTYFTHTIGRPGGGKMETLRNLRQVS